jgi:hypothetical protein
MYDDDLKRDDSYWMYRCEESEQMVCELVEWIESIEDEVYMDEDVLNLVARAKEVAMRP